MKKQQIAFDVEATGKNIDDAFAESIVEAVVKALQATSFSVTIKAGSAPVTITPAQAPVTQAPKA
jgi:hypothetical protein